MKRRNQTIVIISALLLAGFASVNCFAEDTKATTASSTVYAEGDALTVETVSGEELEAVSESDGENGPSAETADSTTSEGGVETENLAPQVDVLAEIEGLEPVTGDLLKDGLYPITVISSSTMFKIVDGILLVEDGELTAVLTMSGKGYQYLYMGTGEEALAESEENYISYEEDPQGNHTFTIPVEALDKGIDCAAFSKKKQKWYDRTIVLESASLPDEAFQDGVLKTVESLGLEDGIYRIDVTLGSEKGKAQVDSPAALTIADGKATAEIVFSSGKYDYVLVDDEKYEAVEGEEKATFEIPVSTLDRKVPIIADSTVMIPATEIAYTLTFDSASVKSVE